MDNILKCHEIVKSNFVRAENCCLYDKEGRKYLDFESGIWCTALGHSHPRIIRNMQSQLDKVAHLGTRYPSFLAQEAAAALLGLLEIDNGKCVFLSSGSEAVEFAVQIARHCTNKPRLLTFANSYLAAYGSAGKKNSAEWHLLDWSTFTPTNPRDFLENLPFEDIGGFVFEPGGSGSNFVKFPPQPLVHDIATQVKRHNALLVANEITTGIGRTGKWFGFQHYSMRPDIIAIGKGLGNGYPISAVVMTKDVADTLERSDFFYAQSHQNDPLGCSVAKDVIGVLHEENLIERGNMVGAFFLDGLKRLEGKHTIVKEARGRGLLLALELHPHQKISVTWLYHELFAKGFLVGYYPLGNILRFDPALTIQKSEILCLLECLDTLLTEAD